MLAAKEFAGNEVQATWSNPDLVISQFGLDPMKEGATKILHEVFGDHAVLAVEVEPNPSTGSPELIFRLNVASADRSRRHEYLDRYARETSLPVDSPVPVLLWSYLDAVPA
jgi:hypothetical protein